jgi:hypothetical protein
MVLIRPCSKRHIGNGLSFWERSFHLSSPQVAQDGSFKLGVLPVLTVALFSPFRIHLESVSLRGVKPHGPWLARAGDTYKAPGYHTGVLELFLKLADAIVSAVKLSGTANPGREMEITK